MPDPLHNYMLCQHRIINDRIEKSIKGRLIGHTGERGRGLLHHGSNVGWTGIALAHPLTTPIPHARPGMGNRGGPWVRHRV